MIFTNGRLILPDGIYDGLEVIESGGKICGIRGAGQYSEHDGFDLGGNYLAPGFVDLHVHGALGRDALEATPEAFRAICDYHATGGTTSLLLTAATAPIEQLLDVLRAAKSAAAGMPQVCGVHLEGPFISGGRAGAQNKEFIRDPDAAMLDRLLEFSSVIKRVTIAPELPGALEVIAKLTELNIASSGGHSDASDEEARAAFARGMRHVTHTFNCMSSSERRGSQRIAGLVEFALSEPEIMCELIADGHHVSTTLMKMLYRAKGTSGICLVTDATAGAGLPAGAQFKLGGVDCIVSDGACWLADRSALAGSAACMIDLVRQMVREVGVPLGEAITMASVNPARALGAKTKGAIEVGRDADFAVISPELEIIQTFLGGEQIFPATVPVATASFLDRQKELRDLERRGGPAELRDIR